MEDCNMLAADCLVISCCCQCLMLQFFIFVLIKLPSKIIRKTREFARRKLRLIGCRKKAKKRIEDRMRFHDEFEELFEESMGIKVEEFGCGNCMEEVERILEELSQKGEFSFGSFWGKKLLIVNMYSSSHS